MIYIILFLGLILRLISLNQSLWLDEATSALAAKMPLTDFFAKFLPGDFHPPLYYLILHFWVKIFGTSEILLRAPSIIFGLGTVYMIYLIGKKLFDQKTGLITSFLLSTSGLHIYYSQEARMYSLAAFFVSLSVYLFLQKKWILFSIILAAIAATDYVSLLILPAFILIDQKNWKKISTALIPTFVFFAVWSKTFLRQLLGGLSQTGSNWWNILGTPSFKNIALIPVKFMFGRISFDNNIVYALAVFFGFLSFGYVILRRPCKVKPCKVIWLWLAVPVILGVILSFKIPTLSYFRFLFALPAFYLLTAFGIEKIGRYKNFWFGLLIAINLFTSFYYLFAPKFHREDWRSAAKILGQDKIIFPVNSQKEALIYYGKENNIVLAKDFSGGEKKVWLSRYVREIFDPQDLARKKVESLGYNKTAEYNFNGVVFWQYGKNRN